MKGEGTPQLSGHCTLQKTWFKWLAIPLYVFGWWLKWTFCYLGITLLVEDGQHWQHSIESIAVSVNCAVNRIWTCYCQVFMWTRITHSLLALCILTFLLVHCICSLLMCLQRQIVLCCWIGGLYWVLCEREHVTWVIAVLKLHKQHHTLALTLWLSPKERTRKPNCWNVFQSCCT